MLPQSVHYQTDSCFIIKGLWWNSACALTYIAPDVQSVGKLACAIAAPTARLESESISECTFSSAYFTFSAALWLIACSFAESAVHRLQYSNSRLSVIFTILHFALLSGSALKLQRKSKARAICQHAELDCGSQVRRHRIEKPYATTLVVRGRGYVSLPTASDSLSPMKEGWSGKEPVIPQMDVLPS